MAARLGCGSLVKYVIYCYICLLDEINVYVYIHTSLEILAMTYIFRSYYNTFRRGLNAYKWKSLLLAADQIERKRDTVGTLMYSYSPKVCRGTDRAKSIYYESLQQLYMILKSLNHYRLQLFYYKRL